MPSSGRRIERSQDIFERAQRYMPGGVSSPVRAFKAVGGAPLVIASGSGSKVRDADGNEYIDYVGAYGPLILGHAHPAVTEAIQRAASNGAAFGATTEVETELAQMVVEAVPSIDFVRFVSSGTEATMSALRLARAFTGRNKIVKFEGCYHGHADGLLAKAGSGIATLGLPDSLGVPPSYAQETLVVPYNDLPAVEALFAEYGSDIAAVIVEPVAANMGVVPPVAGFLQGLRGITERNGALLIFDEVITGFRLAYGGAQSLYGVTPDITCLGKIIGGGLPVGAYGGRREIMELLAPVGPVYQSGTLSGSPLAMAAGVATLGELRSGDAYAQLEALGASLETGLNKAIADTRIAATVQRAGSIMTLFFAEGPIVEYAAARRSDTQRYARYFDAMLYAGVYLAPSQFEAMFLSIVHTTADVEATLQAALAAL